VAVMSSGRLLTQGTLDDLQAAGTARLRVETDDLDLAQGVLRRFGLGDVMVIDGAVSARLDQYRSEDCCRSLVEAGVGVRSLTIVRPSLEDAFVALTGEGFDVAS
jgi:ABC-2 type transport system ATP-binding protein